MSRLIPGFLTVAVAIGTYFLLPESCPEAARRCASVFVVAAGFWAFEVLPVYVTSLVIVLLLSLSLAKPGGVLEMDRQGYTVFLAPFSSPVLMLFFGGFILAEALKKNGADRYLATKFLKRLSSSQITFLFGVVGCTALLSMWLSNTAATVIMLGVLHPVIQDVNINSSMRKGLMLSVPFSANIGGIGTPIGTPPNAMAMGFLSDFNIYIDFTSWMILCVPLMGALLLFLMAVMYFSYLRENHPLPIRIQSFVALEREGRETLIIAGLTIVLWVSSPIHGIPEPLTALLSVGALMVMGLIDRNSIKQINWDVLILMWGGLALGVGIEISGLGHWVIDSFFDGWQGISSVILLASFALLLSLFISNTATAALIIPIALEAAPEHRTLMGVTIALMCSTAMVFPVSTPPNAIAYGTGLIDHREMIKAGALITFGCYIIVVLGFWWIIPAVM